MCARRWAGGVVMRDEHVFVPYISVLLVAIASQVVYLLTLRCANRAGLLLPQRIGHVAALLDTSVACSLMTIVAFHSPRGPLAALTATA